MTGSNGHEFWWCLTIGCVVWYSTVTVYVAIRGASDIKKMLAHLSEDSPERAASAGESVDN
jgi:hypothetical protein